MLDDLSTSQIIKEISELKGELGNSIHFLKKTMKNLIKTISKNELKEIIDNTYSINAKLLSYQNELISRNHNKTINFNGELRSPIELLKIKEKLLFDKKINQIIIETDEDSDELLELSISAFRSSQKNKTDLNELHNLLEEYNNKKGKI